MNISVIAVFCQEIFGFKTFVTSFSIYLLFCFEIVLYILTMHFFSLTWAFVPRHIHERHRRNSEFCFLCNIFDLEMTPTMTIPSQHALCPPPLTTCQTIKKEFEDTKVADRISLSQMTDMIMANTVKQTKNIEHNT